MKMTSSSSSHFHLLDVMSNINSDRPYNHIYNDLLNDYHQQLEKHRLFLSSKQVYIDEETTHEGLGVIDLHGKVIDLNYLARNGDGLYENKLSEMTEGLVSEDELLGFVSDIQGRSGSTRNSGMYVDASVFGDLLPDDWEILLSLRPRVSPPSLCCMKFVSPSKAQFSSCKDVALHLKSLVETNGANPLDEGAMMLVDGDTDSPVECDLIHTNPLQSLVVEDEEKYANPCRDMVLMVDNHQKVRNKKRNRKPKALKNDKSDFKGLGVIYVNGNKIDLLHLARDANREFEAKLSSRTEGLVRDAEFMEFLKDLEGKWSSDRKRRKFVDATILGDGLPKNWEILLSLRPRVYPRSLYCRKFVSPSGEQFKSCKEVAFYIKSLYDANPHAEGDIKLTENDSHVDNQHEFQLRKRKRKSKAVENSDEEYNWGLGVTKVNGEMMDLNYLARVGDCVFEDKLKKITEGLESEDELLGFLESVNGRWASIWKRRIYVYAATIEKLLPVNWQILISLGPHAHQPSLHCRKFVSPKGRQFDSCKDVAFFLKTQSEEEAMMLRERGCQVGPESVARVPRSSARASELNSLGTNDSSYVPIQCLIQCNYCTDSFKSIGVLESHLQRAHKPIIQSLYTETLSQKHSVPCGAVIVQERNSSKQKSTAVYKETGTSRNKSRKISMNEEGSSRMPKPLNEPKDKSDAKRDLKTSCIFCLGKFFHEPADAETPYSSSICPECKEVDASSRFKKCFF